jgi:hypothetical protein
VGPAREGTTLRTGHLVGRTDELRSVEQLLDELDRGSTGAIQLSGEPGIGKTRLLRELAARAEARGHIVLSGSASELERDLPFSVFVDALDQYVAGLEPKQLAVLDDDARAELAHVFPSLWTLTSGREVAPQQERYRCHRAVRALLEHLAETRPLVLVLDDFHWADSASVELLGALLRRQPSAAVLTAVALRPRQTPERLAATLERAHRSAAVTRVDLGALTLDEARQLLGERFDAARIAVLYQESGGNPFYLEQLARSPARAAQFTSAPEISLTGLDVPSAVAASLAEELTLLSDGGRRVLEGAAGRAIHSSQNWRLPPPPHLRRRRCMQSTSSWSLISSGPPTYPDASASDTRSSGALSTRRRLAAGGLGRTNGARRRSRSAARQRWRALTMSSVRRARETSPPLPCYVQRVRQPHGSHRRAPRDGSAERSACSQRRRPCGIEPSFCSPVPGHWRRWAVSPTVMRRCWRQLRWSRNSRVRSRRPSRRRAPALSASSGDTSTRTHAW